MKRRTPRSATLKLFGDSFGGRMIRDLTGQKFGRLLVIKKIKRPENLKNESTYWLCKCDCGNEKIIGRHNLRNGTISCGCYWKERCSKKYGESAKNSKYLQYKNSAKRREISFELSEKEFFELLNGDCFYCGKPPSSIEKGRGNNGNFIYNGIDRVDNKKGYIKKNVVSCCSICNHAKNEMKVDEFYKWIVRVYKKSGYGLT